MIASMPGVSAGSAVMLAQIGRRTEQDEGSVQNTQSTSAASPPPPPPPSRLSDVGSATVQSLFAAMLANDDADGDGSITADEMADSALAAALSDGFGGLDADRNGRITRSETDAAAAAPRSDAAPAPGPPPPPPPQGGAPGTGAVGRSGTASLVQSLIEAQTAAEGSGEGYGAAAASAERFLQTLQATA